jgi:hypothetical protein
MAGRRPRFVGVGIGTYDEGLRPLRSPQSVGNVLVALGHGFDDDVLADATEAEVRAKLQQVTGSFDRSGGVLVAMWSGHGIAAPAYGGVRLLARDSRANGVAGLSPADFVAPCVVSGASQLLFIVEACFSGAALPASDLANWLFERRADGGQAAWFGVIAASRALETARDGVFADALCAMLRTGPVDPELRRRWSAHNMLIRGDDLCDALVKEWPDSIEQLPRYQASGNAWPMLPNPFWNPDAPPQVVEHLLQAARSDSEGERSWFTGRVAEVDKVVSWVQSGTAGVRVVTGLAGTGKSAILGRVVSASVEAERKKLLDQGPLGHRDPGVESVAAHAHARGLVPNQLARELNSGLIRGVLPPDREFADRNVNELLGALEREAQRKGADWRPPVVVVDGLDEARDQAFAIASDLLVRLGRWATVIVSTRNLPGSGEGPDLLTTLAPDAEINLDDPEIAKTGQDAIRQYITNRLDGVLPTMDASAVAEHFLVQTDPVAGQPFLIARLMTAQLRSTPIDTTGAGWQASVSTSLAQAFYRDLADVADPSHLTGAPLPAARRAEELLTALTWGLGAGLPEDEWLAIGTATSTTATAYTRDDIAWLLANLGRYVVEDGEDGSAVYRVAHQTLADQLRPAFRATADTRFDPQALGVANAVLDR